MNQVALKKELLKLEKKLSGDNSTKELVEELISMAERNDRNGLEFKLKELAKHNQALLSQETSDEELARIKAEKKELEAPYREQTKQNRAKSRFIGLLLQELNNFGE